MLAFIVTGTFLFVTIIMNGLYFFLTRKKQRIMGRLEFNLEGHAAFQEEASNPKPQTTYNILSRLSLPKSMLGSNFLALVRNEIYRAGLPIKIEEFIILTLISSLALGAIGGLLNESVLTALLSGIAGICVPWGTVKVMKARRFSRIDQQILETVILLANSLRAGCSFMQAIEKVSREIPMPLAEEFRRVVRENVVGVPLEEALQNMEKRIGSREFSLVVTGVLIQRQIGGNLAETLDIIADTIDKRIKMLAKIKALTAQSRISALVISLMPIGMAVAVFGMHPEFGRIMLEDQKGIYLVSGGAVMWLVGVLSVRKVVRIDV